MFGESLLSGDETAEEYFKPRMAVVGIGGGGNNTVNRLNEMNVRGAGLYAFNTDARQLGILSPEITKLVLGREITRGLGAGGFPDIGEKAAELSRAEIGTHLKNAHLVFITAGMGGGTGTGAAPVVAKMAKESGAVVVGIVTLPFSLERVRIETAKKGLQKLRKDVDTLIVIDNQRLVSLYPNIPIEQTFKIADEITAKAVRGISETISRESLINLDFADVRSILGVGGLGMMGIGSAEGHDRASEVVESAITNKLLNVDYTGAKGVLFHITGGSSMTLGEANTIGEKLTEKIRPEANVTWGARLDPSYGSRIELVAIFTGVSSPELFGNEESEGRRMGIY